MLVKFVEYRCVNTNIYIYINLFFILQWFIEIVEYSYRNRINFSYLLVLSSFQENLFQIMFN